MSRYRLTRSAFTAGLLCAAAGTLCAAPAMAQNKGQDLTPRMMKEMQGAGDVKTLQQDVMGRYLRVNSQGQVFDVRSSTSNVGPASGYNGGGAIRGCATCPPGGLPENEPDCGPEYVDATNGGCNSVPAVFSPISVGQTICGESGTYLFQGLNYRDTDWYEITVTEGSELSWTVTSEFPALIGFVENFGIPDCAAMTGFVNPFGFTDPCVPMTVTACVAPGTYWLFVAPSVFDGVPCGSLYTASLTGGPSSCASPPENDECTGAIDLAHCGGSDTKSNMFATTDPADPIYSCAFGGAAQGNGTIWYKFTATGSDVTITTCGSPTDTMVQLLSGTCGNLTELACNDDAEFDCAGTLQSTVVYTGLTVGETYYVQVASWPGGSRGDITTTIRCEVPQIPDNDLCEDAIAVAVPSSTPGTTANATIDTGVAPDCGSGITSPGVWYTVQGTGHTITATLCNHFEYDAKMSVYCGECGSFACVGGIDDFCGLGPQVSFCSQVGATYHILVHGFGGATGAFTLDITDDGQNCTASVQCLPQGACCTTNGCQIMTQQGCTNAGGSYLGDGTDCGGLSYTAQTCTSAFEDIAATGIALPPCDDCGTDVPIGFNFNFFGNGYSTVAVNSNGFLSFGGTSGDFSNDPIPSTFAPNNIIAPLWDDLNTGAGGTYQYQTLGTAPNRRFIAQWTGVPQFGNSDSNTFQVVLYEGSNDIEFRYGQVTPEAFAGDYSVGIENGDGTVGLAFPSNSPADGVCHRADATTLSDPCDTCRADFDGNGSLSLNDFVQFRNAYVSGNMAADFDGNGVLSLNDFVTFRNEYVAGCP